MKKVFGIILIVLASIIVWQCASQTTPTGGPKDVTPPVLKKSIPENKETNFKGKSVELTFDELLKLNNAKEEIIITPSPGKDVLFTVKANKVFIEPKNGWEDSTTYSLSFREGIQDVNEGNPVVDLRLAFSTGETIDSLQIRGKITESLTEKIPEKITVALYQADTFDIFLHTPSFFTMTDKDGSFKIENLKGGNYYIYAFSDKNKNLKVESKNEKFGFLPKAIPSVLPPLKKNTDTLSIAIYQLDSRPLKLTSARNTGTISVVRFNKNLISYELTDSSHSNLHHSFGENQSEITIYNQLEINDSIPLHIHATDSLHTSIDSTFFVKRIESKLPKEKFNHRILTASINPETYVVKVKAQFTKPIRHINFDSIYLTPDAVPERAPKLKPKDKEKSDSKKNTLSKSEEKKDTLTQKDQKEKKDTVTQKKLTKIPVVPKDIIIDSTKKTLSFSTAIDRLLIKDKIKSINLVLEQAFLTSIESDSSRREIKAIPIADLETTGILHIEVTTKYKNYEIRLLSTNGEVIQKVRNVKKYTFKYLDPQEYKLMVYPDLNNNGEWDAHNFLEHKLEEPTFFYKTQEGKTTFPIRSAWELGPLLLKF